jgi:hypothetical protein
VHPRQGCRLEYFGYYRAGPGHGLVAYRNGRNEQRIAANVGIGTDAGAVFLFVGTKITGDGASADVGVFANSTVANV